MTARLAPGMIALCLIALSGAALRAEQAPVGDGGLALHPDIIAAFEAYRGSLRPGAFAVSEDGAGFGQSLCDSGLCDRAAQRRAALAACRQSADAPCVILASGHDVQRAYRALTRAELSACPLAPVPAIRVIFGAGEVELDRSRTVAELSHLMFDDERHWIDEDGTAMGVTEQFFDIDRHGIGFVEVEGRDGARCVGYKDGEITFTLEARIYVAREIPDDSCLYREVLEHEHKHRSLGHQLTARFAGDLEAELAQALKDQPYVEIPAGDTPWFVAGRRLDEMIDAAYAVFRRDHSRQQLAIDSNEEYHRVELVCPGETARYVP